MSTFLAFIAWATAHFMDTLLGPVVRRSERARQRRLDDVNRWLERSGHGRLYWEDRP